MSKPKTILFKTKEAAEAKTGYFQVSSLMITSELADKISSYISRNDLSTFYQPNQRKTCDNTYTLNFTLKQYHQGKLNFSSQKLGRHIYTKFYLSKPGAIGYYKSDGNTERLEALRARSPTLEQIYFWIVNKYPNDLLWMDFSTEPDSWDSKVNGADEA